MLQGLSQLVSEMDLEPGNLDEDTEMCLFLLYRYSEIMIEY